MSDRVFNSQGPRRRYSTQGQDPQAGLGPCDLIPGQRCYLHCNKKVTEAKEGGNFKGQSSFHVEAFLLVWSSVGVKVQAVVDNPSSHPAPHTALASAAEAPQGLQPHSRLADETGSTPGARWRTTNHTYNFDVHLGGSDIYPTRGLMTDDQEVENGRKNDNNGLLKKEKNPKHNIRKKYF